MGSGAKGGHKYGKSKNGLKVVMICGKKLLGWKCFKQFWSVFERFTTENLRHLILKSPRVCHSFFHSFIPLKISSTVLHNSVRHAPVCRNASLQKLDQFLSWKRLFFIELVRISPDIDLYQVGAFFVNALNFQ